VATLNVREVDERVQERPDRAEHRRRVLHLQFLADEVQQDLAVGDEDAEALADLEVRRVRGALDGGLDGGGHRSGWRATGRRRNEASLAACLVPAVEMR